MAIDLTLKGTAIANREATPQVLNNPPLGAGGIEKVAVGHLASVTASLSITSIIRLVSVPSNAIVTDLKFQSAAQTAGKFDIGLYRTNKDGGAVVDADFFASAVDCASAVVQTDVLNESTTNTIAKQSQLIWQAAGMTSDPKSDLDIALTVVTTDVTTGTGAVGLKVRYAQ
jgi:hypothetical protein